VDSGHHIQTEEGRLRGVN